MLEQRHRVVERHKLAALWLRSLRRRPVNRRLVIDSLQVSFRQLIDKKVGFVDEELGDAGDFVGKLVAERVESVHLLREITFDHNQLIHELVEFFLKQI